MLKLTLPNKTKGQNIIYILLQKSETAFKVIYLTLIKYITLNAVKKKAKNDLTCNTSR